MANDIWTPPSGPVAGVADLAEMQAQRTDDINVLALAVDGDSSASTIKHRHRTGTLAARPAAGEAGRMYFATDINSVFLDDGTRWRIVSASAYDGFTRANSTTITPADSGHAWTEEAGNLEISGNALQVVSAAAASIASLNMGGLLDYAADFTVNVRTSATAADIDTAIIVRYLDASNFLYCQLAAGAINKLRIVKVIATVHTELRSLAFTPTANVTYILRAHMAGPYVLLQAWQSEVAGGSNILSVDARNPADTLTPFLGATRCGLRIVNDVADKVGSFSASAH